MAFVSLLLWGVSALLGVGDYNLLPDVLGLGYWGSRLLSLFLYAAVAFMLGSLYILERRAQWLPALFLWLSAVFMVVQPCYATALSLLLLLLSLMRLFQCVADKGQECTLFGAFALLSFSSLLFVQFAFLLPLFIAYMSISRIARGRNFLAAFLGVVTPYWLLFGAVYAFPSAGVLLLPFKASLAQTAFFVGGEYALSFYVWLAIEVAVWLVATYVYVSSFYPAKPLLRRRFLLIILLNAYLMLLSFAIPHNFLLFLVWRMPGVAIMSSYLFAMKVTRLSNICFILLNAAWLSITFICLWNG